MALACITTFLVVGRFLTLFTEHGQDVGSRAEVTVRAGLAGGHAFRGPVGCGTGDFADLILIWAGRTYIKLSG